MLNLHTVMQTTVRALSTFDNAQGVTMRTNPDGTQHTAYPEYDSPDLSAFECALMVADPFQCKSYTTRLDRYFLSEILK